MRHALSLGFTAALIALAPACSPQVIPTASPTPEGSAAPPAPAAASTRANPAPRPAPRAKGDTETASTPPAASGSPQPTAAAKATASAAASIDPRFPPPLPPSAPGAPDLRKLLVRLRPYAARRFDAAAQERGCPADQTLGQYLDLLTREGSPPGGSPPGDLRRLSGTCIDFPPPSQRIQIDPPADPAHWFCLIESFASDVQGESPWHYELRLRVRRPDGALDLAHLACPGTP